MRSFKNVCIPLTLMPNKEFIARGSRKMLVYYTEILAEYVGATSNRKLTVMQAENNHTVHTQLDSKG